MQSTFGWLGSLLAIIAYSPFRISLKLSICSFVNFPFDRQHTEQLPVRRNCDLAVGVFRDLVEGESSQADTGQVDPPDAFRVFAITNLATIVDGLVVDANGFDQ